MMLGEPMKKKLEIYVYHLGYGGIEKAVSSLCKMLGNVYDISIISLYQLYEKPIFEIPSNVSITYLYQTDLPLKMKKYKQLLLEKKFGEFFQSMWKDYFCHFHFLQFFHDFGLSFYLDGLGGKYRKLKKYLASSQADIFLSTRWEISRVFATCKNSSAIQIGWEHNHYHGDLVYKKHVIESSKNLDYLVLVSRALAKDYQREMAVCKCRPIYIPNVIDFPLSFCSDYQSKHLLFVGRLEKEKGLFDAFEVMKRLQERKIVFHFDLVGDGPLRNRLEEFVQHKNLKDYVTFHGFQNHAYIENLMQHTTLFVMCSHTESFGLVLLEAMNAGIPCMAFDSAEGARELIIPNVNGYLITRRNVDEMAEKISELLLDLPRVQLLGKQAKEFSKNFLPASVQVMWRKIMEDD